MSYSPTNPEFAGLINALREEGAVKEQQHEMLTRVYHELRTWRSFASAPYRFYPPAETVEPYETNVYLLREKIMAAPKFEKFTSDIANTLADESYYLTLSAVGEVNLYQWVNTRSYEIYDEDHDEDTEYEDGMGFVDADGDLIDGITLQEMGSITDSQIKGVMLINFSNHSQFVVEQSENIPGVRNQFARTPPTSG